MKKLCVTNRKLQLSYNEFPIIYILITKYPNCIQNIVQTIFLLTYFPRHILYGVNNLLFQRVTPNQNKV